MLIFQLFFKYNSLFYSLLSFIFSIYFIYFYSNLYYFLLSVCLDLVCSSFSSFFQEKIVIDLSSLFLLIWRSML